jgi:hypothetical protein
MLRVVLKIRKKVNLWSRKKVSEIPLNCNKNLKNLFFGAKQTNWSKQVETPEQLTFNNSENNHRTLKSLLIIMLLIATRVIPTRKHSINHRKSLTFYIHFSIFLLAQQHKSKAKMIACIRASSVYGGNSKLRMWVDLARIKSVEGKINYNDVF